MNISKHAITRYNQRFKNNNNELSEEEITSLSEDILDKFNKSILLFQGDLFNNDSHSKFYIFKNIIFVIKNDDIVTVWKVFNNNKDKVSEILSLKDLSLKLKTERDILIEKYNSLYNIKQSLLNKNPIDTNVIANINKERKKKHISTIQY